MTAILEFLTSAFAGGLTGILGHGVKEWLALRRLKAESRMNAEERQHELDVMRLEIQGREQVAVIQREEATEVAAYGALSASYAHDRASYSDRVEDLSRAAQMLLVIVDVARGMTRPGVTWGSVIVLAYMAAVAGLEAGVKQDVVDALIYVSVTAVTWWFADRPKKQARA